MTATQLLFGAPAALLEDDGSPAELTCIPDLDAISTLGLFLDQTVTGSRAVTEGDGLDRPAAGRRGKIPAFAFDLGDTKPSTPPRREDRYFLEQNSDDPTH